MNDKENDPLYSFRLVIPTEALVEFQRAFAEMAQEHEDQLLEMTGYAEAKEVIASIKAKL
jgi:hypothetical protein